MSSSPQEPVTALTMLRPGNQARVLEVRGGRGGRQRLYSMGIYPGQVLSVVRGGAGGPVIVEARGSRVVIGRGMAHRVMMTEVR